MDYIRLENCSPYLWNCWIPIYYFQVPKEQALMYHHFYIFLNLNLLLPSSNWTRFNVSSLLHFPSSTSNEIGNLEWYQRYFENWNSHQKIIIIKKNGMEKWPAKKINACMTSFDLVMNKKVSDFFFLLACKSS